MNDFEKSIQPDIDRLGAIARLYCPESSIKRYCDYLVVKKDYFNYIKFDFDQGELAGEASARPVGFGSLFIQYDQQWIEDTFVKIYSAFYSDALYSYEEAAFRKRYGKFRYFDRLRVFFVMIGFFSLMLFVGLFKKGFDVGFSSFILGCVISGVISLLMFWLGNLKIKVEYSDDGGNEA